jgi:hypothetical protein
MNSGTNAIEIKSPNLIESTCFPKHPKGVS